MKMARCGCVTGCGCVLDVGPGLTLSGTGGFGTPWVVGVADTGWLTLSGAYQNAYTPYAGATFFTPQYRVLGNGWFVQLRGRIEKNGATAMNQQILTNIPAAVIPQRTVWFPVASLGTGDGDNGAVSIDNTGVISSQSTLSTTWISLDGLTYSTAV